MKDSIFTMIINGDIPSMKVYEDDNFIAILDISPKQMGHTLVIPKQQVENLLQEDDLTRNELMSLVTKLSNQIKTNLNATGIKIQTNIGSSAGQEVFHTHIHIIPFYDENIEAINNDEVLNKILG